MPSVGQIEKKTQERVLALLSQRLGYTTWATGSTGPPTRTSSPNA